ncbi:MAG: enolase C-terminal domain-like protein [Isosphaeraceae bacterium]
MPTRIDRRDWFRRATMGLAGCALGWERGSARGAWVREAAAGPRITGLTITPVALPDPPLLFAGGCHGPYFLRNIIELTTDAGIVGLGETSGGASVTRKLEQARSIVLGQSVFAYRAMARALAGLSPAVYAGIEIACLDAAGKATGRRVCDLVGGPVRPSVEVAAYLFYRYAADHPVVLADPRLADGRGSGSKALDAWGEVRTPEAMAAMAAEFRRRWGFRSFKLKAGVLPPDRELATLERMRDALGADARLRIDPNGRWSVGTAVRIGEAIRAARLNLEYYEDPVRGQPAMAEVRTRTKLPMSTNMCVTRFEHLPEAFRVHPIDVLLTDLHYFGGFAGNLALGPVADAAGWTLSQHSNNHAGITMSAMIHLAACLPQLTAPSDTHYPWLPDDADLIEGPKLPIHNGQMSVPTGPGLGVALDRDRLARARETYQKCGMHSRDDAPLMKRLEPGWTGADY